MFRDMIKTKCEAWYNSDECTVKDLISYISKRGAMRDAQIEAIKVYLFLKIKCRNRPLRTLIGEGAFNTLDMDMEPLPKPVREFLQANPEAAAFYEFVYIESKTDKNALKVLDAMRLGPKEFDYVRILDEMFGNPSYTDYIFSLPMGAGKTFLMAAFMYLDLYLSAIDPDNPAFAENFIVIAPSGLKNSIVPSLRTIENFDPDWIIPNSQQLKREMHFDVLDAESEKGDSNKVRNPNARKVSMYLQGGDARGMALVTNAEKVISDLKLDKEQTTLDGSSGGEFFLNELRAQIARIPRLSIFIDEAHHTASEEIKLCSVVSMWAEKGHVVSVIGFTGTPYVEKPLKIMIKDKLKLSCTELTNVVEYYSLVEGIGNFLKTPEIRQYEDRENYIEIVNDGLRSFFEKNADFHYPKGHVSKLAIYCNSIEELENTVYPEVCRVVSSFGMDPNRAVLRYHEDKPGYKLAPDARMEFATLDEPDSQVRVVLLVQIGKEGWDCRSLAGVILAKENKSTRNMVLQTCCRCLRQVEKYDTNEHAWIYLCQANADILEAQLKEQQHITLKEFQTGTPKELKVLNFYNRRDVIGLPELVYYQFRVGATTVVSEEADPERSLNAIPLESMRNDRIVRTTNLQFLTKGMENEDNEYGEWDVDIANFGIWLGEIAKGGFEFVSRRQLYKHVSTLRKIFDAITIERNGVRYFSSRFDRPRIESLIRQSFYDKHGVDVVADYEIETASLIDVYSFPSRKEVSNPSEYVPDQIIVSDTIEKDRGGFEGREEWRRQYHYMPYHMDSGLELEILDVLHGLICRQFPDLEVYYNGDRFITDFHIRCYERIGIRWRYIGRYTPDFLVLQRIDDEIAKVVLIETKGTIYSGSQDFQLRRRFVEDEFIPYNNEKGFGAKFDYLYIQDDIPSDKRIKLIIDKIQSFFEVQTCQ